MKHKGGILLTALLFIYLFSFIFILVLEDFKLTQQFVLETKNFYIAKTMVSMFLFDLKQENKEVKHMGQECFSSGSLEYTYDQNKLNFSITIGGQRYNFQENYKIRSEEKAAADR